MAADFENIVKQVKGDFSVQDLKKEIEILEEKEDNCIISDKEKKRLTYLIWKYTNGENTNLKGEIMSSDIEKEYTHEYCVNGVRMPFKEWLERKVMIYTSELKKEIKRNKGAKL